MKPNRTRRVAIESGSFTRGQLTGEPDLHGQGDPPDTELPLFEGIPDPCNDQRAPALTPALVRLPRVASLTRDRVRRRRLVALGVSVAWVVAHLGIYGVRTDWADLTTTYISAQVLVPFLLAVVSLWIALSQGPRGLGLDARWLWVMAVLGPAAFWVAAFGVPEPYVTGTDDSFWISLFVCLDLTLAWVAVPLVAAGLTLQRAFPAAAAWKSGLVGAAAGLFCGATMNLHCPSIDPAHVGLAHGIPVLIASAVGAFILVRWARA